MDRDLTIEDLEFFHSHQNAFGVYICCLKNPDLGKRAIAKELRMSFSSFQRALEQLEKQCLNPMQVNAKRTQSERKVNATPPVTDYESVGLLNAKRTQSERKVNASIKEEQRKKQEKELSPLLPFTLEKEIKKKEEEEKESPKKSCFLYKDKTMEDFVNLYYGCLPTLPKFMGDKLSDKRKTLVQRRIKELGGWDKLEEFLKRAGQSDFLTGRKTDWKAGFEFLFERKDSWIKVLEGQYDNVRHNDSGREQLTVKRYERF